jgi:hypothetical protein
MGFADYVAVCVQLYCRIVEYCRIEGIFLQEHESNNILHT